MAQKMGKKLGKRALLLKALFFDKNES